MSNATSNEFASRLPGGGSLAEAYRKARTSPGNTQGNTQDSTLGGQPISSQNSDQEQPAAEPQESFLPGTATLARRHQVMLQLCLHGGNTRAFGYNYLVAAEMNPSTGIVLDFTGWRVRLEGRNLQPLFDALAHHKVGKIFQTDPLHARLRAESDTVVTGIEFLSLL